MAAQLSNASYSSRSSNRDDDLSLESLSNPWSSGYATAAREFITGSSLVASQVASDPGFELLLLDLSSALFNAASHEVDAQIEAALGKVMDFLEVDRALFGEVDVEGSVSLTHFYVRAGIPVHPRVVTDLQLSWWADRVRHGEVVALSRLPDDLPEEAVAERVHCVNDGVKSHLTTPVIVAGSVLCFVTVVTIRAHHEWTDDVVRRLRLFGAILANAVARKRAGDSLREREQSLQRSKDRLRKLAGRLLRAQEEERRRVAREMHDDWAQRLALLGITAAQAEAGLTDPKSVRPLLRVVQQQVAELAEDMHDISRQLHPSILDDLGLVEALHSECARVARREKLKVTFKSKSVPLTLGDGVALSVYRVAQEALRNIVKHAAAKTARVTLSADGGELLLRVADDGLGFDPTARSGEPGLGHASMTERVYIIGGRLTIDAAPGRGTVVEVRAPIEGVES